MAADSPYGCLMVDGHVVVATQKWWSLSGTELVLLGMLVSGLPPSTSRDVPIYLPHGSPTVRSEFLKKKYCVIITLFPCHCLFVTFKAREKKKCDVPVVQYELELFLCLSLLCVCMYTKGFLRVLNDQDK